MVDEVTVLCVDDRRVAESTGDRLEREGDRFSVRTATTATDALSVLDGNGVDCVVSGAEIPGGDGLALLDTVRAEYPNLPFVLFPAEGSDRVASEAVARGATAYLPRTDGVEQYEALADRIQDAVERHHTVQRAAGQARVDSVVREINQALVRADSRAAIERRVCELLGDVDPYSFVWVGEHDPATSTIEPTSSAGGERSYLDDVTIRTDETATGQGPAGRAFRTGDIVVSQDVREDPSFEPWREAALAHGFRAAAAVPLSYDGDWYGLLVVYADRPEVFDESERALLAELGDDIAHALQARDAQDALKRTSKRLESLFENSPDMINVHDKDGQIIDANPALCEALGYEKSDLVGMNVWEIDPNIVPDAARRLWDNLETDDRHELETEFRRRDGSTFPVEVHIRRICVEGEEEFVVSGRDISDHEARQRQLEARSAALASATDGMAILDEGDEYVFVNQAHAEVYGYDDPAAFVGESWQKCYSESEVERFQRDVFPELEAEGEWLGAATGLRADGETFPQEVSLTRLDDGGLICVVRDVTEREEHRRKLELVQRRTRTLMTTQTVEESAQVAVDTAHEVIGAEISGYHALSEDGQRLRLLTETEPMVSAFEVLPEYERDSDDPVSSVIWEVFEESEPRHIEDTAEYDRLAGNTPAGSAILYPVADHGVFIVSATATDAFDETDRTLLDILTSTFTVALQRVERESLLREREAELTRQNEQLEEFASVVSHDLRNPLSVLEGSLELAETTGDTEHFDRAERALDRMDQLIEDLLTLARQGESVDEMVPVDVDSVVAGCWQNVATGAASLRTEPSGRICADESRFKQLLENLIRNSVEHASTSSRPQSVDSGGHSHSDDWSPGADDDPVTVRIGPLRDGSGFYVEDDGPGVPPSEREAVFESGYSNSTEGSGFGLAIVGRIVDAHGWDVDLCESDAGGARFEISGVERPE